MVDRKHNRDRERIVVAIDSLDSGGSVLESALARAARQSADVWAVVGSDSWCMAPRARAGRPNARDRALRGDRAVILAWLERASRGRLDAKRVFLGSGPFAQDVLMTCLEVLPRWLVFSSASAEDGARVCRLIGCSGVSVHPPAWAPGFEEPRGHRLRESLILPFRDPHAPSIAPATRSGRGPLERWGPTVPPPEPPVDR